VAFEALEVFPALAESRDRLLSGLNNGRIATADIVSAVESDVALVIAVLRLANTAQPGRARVETTRSAVELLHPQILRALAGRVHTFDFFEHPAVWGSAPKRFRLHALATRRAADRIACEVHYANRDRLAVTSLLHDIGKLVLMGAYAGYPSQVHRGARIAPRPSSSPPNAAGCSGEIGPRPLLLSSYRRHCTCHDRHLVQEPHANRNRSNMTHTMQAIVSASAIRAWTRLLRSWTAASDIAGAR
jgi:HD-like signal output (HDOD) protein